MRFFKDKAVYNEVMATRGFKTPLNEDGEEVPGYLMGFTGDDLKKLEKLKEHFDLDEEQDVVRLAIRTMEKIIEPKTIRVVKKPKPTIHVKRKETE